MTTSPIPESRITVLVDRPPNPDGAWVLYWMTASRRTGWNFALQRAVAWAIELARPLVVLEAVRVDHPWANDRLHQFLIDGMAAGAVKEGTKPIWEKLDTFEMKVVAPLTVAVQEVAKSVAAVGLDVQKQIANLEIKMLQTHPTKSEFAAMKIDIDRIAERLTTPPELVEMKQAGRRQR